MQRPTSYLRLASMFGLAALCLVAGSASFTALEAQQIDGLVDQPGRWLLRLIPEGGGAESLFLTGSDGRFSVPAPAGEYRLEVSAVDTEVATHDVVVPAVGLSGLRLEGPPKAPPLPPAPTSDVCRLRPDHGTPAGQAWSRAWVAFAMAVVGLEEGGLSLDAEVFDRDLGEDGRRVLREAPTETRVAVRRLTPAMDPADLVSRGFVREEDDGSYRFFAPGPEVFLSEAFADSHCLRIRPDGGPTLTALAFEPVESEDGRPDVEGVLWLETTTGNPLLLEFAYRNFDLGIPLGGVGGRSTFVVLPDGSWVVAESRLRMPLLEVEQNPEGGAPSRWALRGMREEGFRVRTVRAGSEGWSLGAEGGVVEGTVSKHVGAGPLSEARVYLPGTPHSVFTDERGRFRLEGLLEGVYQIAAEHAELDALPVGASGRVSVAIGEVTRFDLAAPEPEAAAVQMCRGQSTTGPRVILSGQVRDSITSEPLAGIPLTLRFRDMRRSGSPQHEAQIFSGTGGEYVYCDLPPEVEIRVRADTPGSDGRSDERFFSGSAGSSQRRDVTVALSTEQGPSGVFGMVRDVTTGRGLEAARVRIKDSDAAVLTNRNGFFSFSDLPQGLYVLEVATLGYQAREIVVRLSGSGAYKVDVDLSIEAIALEGITVTAVPRRLFGDMVDMQRRMELGFGDFVMKEELERRGGSLATALQGKAGVRVITGAGGFRERYIVLRNGRDLPGGGVTLGAGDGRGQGGAASAAETFCYPAVYVDGSRWSRPKSGGVGHDPVDFNVFYTMDLEAVEIYKGAGSVPGEFGGGDAACGAIVVWTRRGGVTVRGTARGGGGDGGGVEGAAAPTRFE